MQDASYLAKTFNVSNTKDLQNHPVDFHVLADCKQGECQAQGNYKNDDGETLDPTEMNLYTIQYNQDL